ncbi:hypothetical protein F4825DRAFT_418906 [Nemania diffusa]|nr:hypothetical protein F4825DRAFT_418906 [Nemania diffusa]
MSGLEIAGLVLGALPLAIQAVQGYREALHSISPKHVKRYLDSIERDLQTEHLRLQNTCETLLVGIVSQLDIQSMIKDPFGPGWKSYVDKLRLRLYASYDAFDECIKAMYMAIKELKSKLGIEGESRINSRDRQSILETLKKRTSFILKRKEFEGILSSIKASNDTLQDLSRENRGLELDRRRRSQSRVTNLFRGLSQSIYNALCSAITCTCMYPHSVGLQLPRENIVILPNDIEEDIAQNFVFPITLKVTNKKKALHIQHSSEVQAVCRWRKFQMRLIVDDKAPPSLATLSLSASPSPGKKIGWAPSIINAPNLPQSPELQLPTKGLELPPSRVSDLCSTGRRGLKTKAVNCYGYLLDTQRKFILSPPDDDTGLNNHVTLRQVIEGDSSGLPPFGFEERLRVALALSTHFLHLNGTPWLAQTVALDDIAFMVESEDTMIQPSHLLYQPFVIKAILRTPELRVGTPQITPPLATSPSQTVRLVRPTNVEVFSLGTLLIQIIVGRVEDELSMAGTMDPGSIASRRKRGSKLEGEILENGGMNYAAAVKWCLDSAYRVASLQNEKLCQEFYEAVITRLEDDLETITSG